MSVLENFKNIPRSPYGGDMAQMYFFSSNLQRSPWRKKKRGACRPPQRATGPCRPPQGRQAPVARWGATGSCVLAWPTKPIEFHSSSVRRFIVIYLQKDLEIEFELS